MKANAKKPEGYLSIIITMQRGKIKIYRYLTRFLRGKKVIEIRVKDKKYFINKFKFSCTDYSCRLYVLNKGAIDIVYSSKFLKSPSLYFGKEKATWILNEYSIALITEDLLIVPSRKLMKYTKYIAEIYKCININVFHITELLAFSFMFLTNEEFRESIRELREEDNNETK